MTAPAHVTYRDVLTVWQDADTQGVFDHAWLYDHLMPLGGDPLGPAFEGWTLLTARAAQTQHLQIGLMVTSNRFRPPAILAKMTADVDIVSGGRLMLGIEVGSRPDHPLARREYLADDIPFIATRPPARSLAPAYRQASVSVTATTAG